MYKKILVPLDGSARAERALPIAARIVRMRGGSLVLLRVANLLYGYGPYLVQAPSLVETALSKELNNAKEYLDQRASKKDLEGIPIQTEVMLGMESEDILDYAQSHNIDLIVMCSHGGRGFTRWPLGSVTQKVVRSSDVPVLILHEAASLLEDLQDGKGRTIRALVGLDGSALAEAALVPAAQLVTTLSAPDAGALHLTCVVKLPPPSSEREQPVIFGRDGTAWDVTLEEKAFKESAAYLHSIADRLRSSFASEAGLEVTWSVMRGDDVAHELITMAAHGKEVTAFEGCDLIALATHGRGGLRRWIMGSVTEDVLSATSLPTLVVRPAKVSAASLDVGGVMPRQSETTQE